MKILVADDELTSRILLQRTLSVYGKCDAVMNGQEAVDAFRLALEKDEKYNLICLDIMMPVMDGHETVRQIRKLEEDNSIDENDRTKVIMITSLNDAGNIMTAMQAKGNAYIVKPVSKEKIRNRLVDLGFNIDLSE